MTLYSRGFCVNSLFPVSQKSLQQSMDEPEFQMTDFGKMMRPAQLHIAFQVTHIIELHVYCGVGSS